jgi:hypothetical protein
MTRWIVASALLLPALFAAQADAAPRYLYEMRSFTGTAVADARTTTPPECQEDTGFHYVESGHYEVSFRYSRRGAHFAGGTDVRADDGSVGPRLAIDNAPGRQTIRFSENIGHVIGRGEGNGCDVTFQRCEGTYTRTDDGELFSAPRGRAGRQTFRRGVLIDWPRQPFVGDATERCGLQYTLMETIASDGAHPVAVTPLRSFRGSPRRRRITIRLRRQGTLENTEGLASTATWRYRAALRLRRSRTR